MLDENRIHLLARIAQAKHGGDPNAKPVSILALAAASYGSRPTDESTVPTGFDPAAVALFESIVEGAYLVASADGVFDEDERMMFERVVTTACDGAVPAKQIEALVGDLADQLSEDGLEKRIAVLVDPVQRKEQAHEVLRIAALLAMASENISDVERSVLDKIASALKLDVGAVESAINDVKQAIAT